MPRKTKKTLPINNILNINDELVDKVLQNRKAKTKEELTKFKTKDKIVTKGKRKGKYKDLENLLRDKSVANQDDFTEAGAKTAGVSAGYIANEKATKNKFILKQFYKSASEGEEIIQDQYLDNMKKNIIQKPLNDQLKQMKNNRRDGVHELLAASMYEMILYNRAPKEQLVVSNTKNQDSLYVRSKFFKDASTLDQFTGAANTRLNYHNDKLKKVEGFEKTIAACNVLGELDYHAGNMMVQKQGNAYVMTKIDHGRSLMAFNVDFMELTTKLNENFKQFNYQNAINAGNLSFNVREYSNALNGMLKGLGEEQINNIVDKTCNSLKTNGFNLDGFRASYNFKDSAWQGKNLNNFDEMQSFYKDVITRNIENLKVIAKDVEIVAKFDAPKEFLKGGWVQKIAESGHGNPIIYAAMNNIKINETVTQIVNGQPVEKIIGKKNALIWAKENNYSIDSMQLDKINRTEEQTTWQKTGAKWQEQQATVNVEKTRDKVVKGIEPLEYILDKYPSMLSQDVKDFVAGQASNNSQEIVPLSQNAPNSAQVNVGKPLTSKTTNDYTQRDLFTKDSFYAAKQSPNFIEKFFTKIIEFIKQIVNFQSNKNGNNLAQQEARKEEHKKAQAHYESNKKEITKHIGKEDHPQHKNNHKHPALKIKPIHTHHARKDKPTGGRHQ